SPFENLPERLRERHLHRQDERITEEQDAAFAGRLGSQLLVVAEPRAVDRDVGGEFRRGEMGPRVRLQPEPDRRIVFEESLERWRRLGAAPCAQRRFEYSE